MDETAFADWSYPGRGLIRGEALAKFVREKTGGKMIEQMRLPLGIAATDLDSGEGILFQRGDTGTAVRASSAVPAVFQPVKIGKHEYVDGGLSAPVPVHHAHAMGAEFVIAVDISAVPEGNATGDAARMLLQTFAIMGRSIKNYELHDADLVLSPKLAGRVGGRFHDAAAIDHRRSRGHARAPGGAAWAPGSEKPPVTPVRRGRGRGCNGERPRKRPRRIGALVSHRRGGATFSSR